jgi:hypothetical protein
VIWRNSSPSPAPRSTAPLPGRRTEAHEARRHRALKMARHLPIHAIALPLSSRAQITGGYCWPTPFNVLGVLFLGKVFPAFLPSKKTCWPHEFRHWGVGQQYPGVYLIGMSRTAGSMVCRPATGRRPPTRSRCYGAFLARPRRRRMQSGHWDEGRPPARGEAESSETGRKEGAPPPAALTARARRTRHQPPSAPCLAHSGCCRRSSGM